VHPPLRLLLVAALFAPPLAGAQSPPDPRLSRLDPRIRDSVAIILDAARTGGLPATSLLEKALEGTFKNAPAPLVLAAVRRLQAELAAARDALGSTSTPAELDAGASALHAGARGTDLTRLRARRPARSLVVPLAVLSDLVAGGVPVDSASNAVLTLAAAASDNEYVEFRRDVDRDIALGAPPAAAAAVRLSSTARLLGASSGPTGSVRKP
jgi:hypothetical protein